MKVYVLIAIVAGSIPCLAVEPNDYNFSPDLNVPAEPEILDFNGLQAALLDLQEQLDDVIDRLERLESRSKSTNVAFSLADDNLPAGPDKDAVRLERARKQVAVARAEITVADSKITSYPSFHYSDALNSRYHVDFDERLEKASVVYNLLSDIEDNLLIILRCAEKNPDLKISASSVKQELISCRSRKKEVAYYKSFIRKLIRRSRQDKTMQVGGRTTSAPRRTTPVRSNTRSSSGGGPDDYFQMMMGGKK